MVVNDETNLLRLITPWLDNSCQIKPKRGTSTFSQIFRELNTPQTRGGASRNGMWYQQGPTSSHTPFERRRRHGKVGGGSNTSANTNIILRARTPAAARRKYNNRFKMKLASSFADVEERR